MQRVIGQLKDSDEVKAILANTFWSFRGKVVYALLQTVYYVFLARVLGAEQFGVFIGLLAFTGFFHPFVGWGYDSILIRSVARDKKTYPHSLGLSIVVHGVSGVAMLLLSMLVNEFFFREPFFFILLFNVMVAESLLRITEFYGRAFQAFERLNAASKIWAVSALFKLLAVAFFWLIGEDHSVILWSWYYLAGSLIGVFVTTGATFLKLGTPSFRSYSGSLRFDFWEGFAFSISRVSTVIYSDVDKFMLLKLSGQYAAGIYSAAYQFIKAAYFPILSVFLASYPKFFQKGFQGATKIWAFIKKVLLLTGSLGLLVSAILFVAAPLVPVILGEDYTEAVQILRWLAIVPFLQSIYVAFADALSGADLQKLRSTIQAAVVILNVTLNFWLIPLYSWWGAVVATIASETVLLLAFSSLAMWHWFKPQTK